MKKLFYKKAILSAVIAFNVQSASALEPLSKEELTPFCANQNIWGHFNLSAEKCLEAAVPCSNDTAKAETDAGKATEKLMMCIMEKNDITIPTNIAD